MEWHLRFGTDGERQVADRLVSYVEAIRPILVEIAAESEAAFELRVKWLRKEVNRDELQARLDKLLNNLDKYQQWYAGFLRDEMKPEFQSISGGLLGNFNKLATYCNQDAALLEQKLGSCHSCADDAVEGINQFLGLPTNYPY